MNPKIVAGEHGGSQQKHHHHRHGSGFLLLPAAQSAAAIVGSGEGGVPAGEGVARGGSNGCLCRDNPRVPNPGAVDAGGELEDAVEPIGTGYIEQNPGPGLSAEYPVYHSNRQQRDDADNEL